MDDADAGSARGEDHLPLLRGGLRRAGEGRRGRRGERSRRPRSSGQFRPAVLQGLGARRDARAGGAAAPSRDRRRARRLGRRRSIWSPRRFSRTIAEHGPDSVAFYVSGQLLTEDYYVANKLMKGFIGSANIDTNSRLCMASSVAGHRRAFGSDTVPGSYEDLELADLVVLVGSNLAWCHPVLYQRIAAAKEKRPGMQVVLIDPRRTMTADIADLHLAIAPDGDVALFTGLLAYPRRECGARPRLYRGPHQRLRRARLPPRRGSTSPKSPSGPASMPRQLAALLSRCLRRRRRTVTVFSQGVNQSTSGTDKVNAIINCHLATGRIGKPGAGPVLDHRPAQRDGRARGRRPGQHAGRPYGDREPGASRARAALLGLAGHRREAGPEGGRHVPGRRRRAHQGAVDHGDQSGRFDAGRRRRRGGDRGLPVRRRLRRAGRDRHHPPRPCQTAGRRLGREGRHGHQFGAAHLAPAPVPGSAGRGAAGLVDHRRGRPAHGLRAKPLPTARRRRSSPSMPRCRRSRTRARATSTSAPMPASTAQAYDALAPFQWPRPGFRRCEGHALLRRRRLLHAGPQGALRRRQPAPRNAHQPAPIRWCSTPAACATIGTP